MALVDAIPSFVMNGLTVLGKVLPALGISLLLNMIYEKGNMIFLLLGFLAASYLKLPLIAIALFGIVIVVVLGAIDKNLLDNKKIAEKRNQQATSIEATSSLEEDFFNE